MMTAAAAKPLQTMNPPLAERDMEVPVRIVGGTVVNQIGNPLKFKSGHYYGSSCGLALGYPNREVLAHLDFSNAQIEEIEASQTMAQA